MTTAAAETKTEDRSAPDTAAANTNSTALAPVADAQRPPAAPRPIRQDDPNLNGAIAAFASGGNFDTANRIAIALSESSIVPPAYRGQKGVPNCLIAIEMANRIGAGVLAVIQHLNVINNKPGWDATFLIGTVNTSGKFGRMKYKFVGERGTDEWGCYAYAKDLDDGEILIGTTITIKMAKAEGWYDRNGSKWPTMPEQMLMYRAASFWTRVHAPEISLGMHSTDELEDMGPAAPLPVAGGLGDIPHADTANTGNRMKLGKPAAAPVQDAQIVPTPSGDEKAAPASSQAATEVPAAAVPAPAKAGGDAPSQTTIRVVDEHDKPIDITG
jgi:hypothetical protein